MHDTIEESKRIHQYENPILHWEIVKCDIIGFCVQYAKNAAIDRSKDLFVIFMEGWTSLK